MLKESPFGSYLFTPTELGALVDITMPTLAAMVKAGEIKPVTAQRGAVPKKFYDWNSLGRAFEKYKYKKTMPPKNKVWTFTNLKGGVGKTTLSSQLAMKAATMGLKVLLIDIDPQGNSSFGFGFQTDDDRPKTIFDMMKGEPLENVVFELTPTLHLIPGHIGLNEAEFFLRSKNNGQKKLAVLMQSIKPRYDIIILDTNAALTYLSINAILAADELGVVTQTKLFSVSGMTKMFDIITELHNDYLEFNPYIRIIPNLHDSNENVSQDAMSLLNDQYGEFVTDTVVRKSAAFDHAQNKGHAVILSEKKSNAAVDIEALAEELFFTGKRSRLFKN